jgi:hypothetical protein
MLALYRLPRGMLEPWMRVTLQILNYPVNGKNRLRRETVIFDSGNSIYA